ncbi:MAG: DUF3426 domain-containing protein [Kiloniellales bacterium]|nr:DUF3426 domain-containing protein [Kiloniellales bacterium]
MILECPSCAARFNVDSDLIGTEGRTVRCGSCGHSWHQTAEQLDIGLEIVVEEAEAGVSGASLDIKEDDIEARLSETRRRTKARNAAATVREKPGSKGLPVGWLLLLLVVGGVAAGGVLGRTQIIAMAPATSKVYEMVGLETAVGAGLEMKEVTSTRTVIDGISTLLIRGVIVNATGEELAIPRMQARLVDAAGVELASWEFDANAPNLPPGGFTNFETKTQDPPPQGNVKLAFIK